MKKGPAYQEDSGTGTDWSPNVCGTTETGHFFKTICGMVLKRLQN